ncbi:hypothetical protein M885DRAFT_538486 [Pelagophyceae sp. CCMP2097]|nr:hypothetical protein M885DRAFT_538486 [Pelagophyceae sp. CCMP2097]
MLRYRSGGWPAMGLSLRQYFSRIWRTALYSCWWSLLKSLTSAGSIWQARMNFSASSGKMTMVVDALADSLAIRYSLSTGVL